MSEVILRDAEHHNDLDFSNLRSEAIKLVQQLSGKIWTDYNLHDPGVTILELLCFSITELDYQAGDSVAEYLSDQHGIIDFRNFGLFKPHEIFTNSAVTPNDYCKLFADSVPEIDAIKITADNHYPNVYNLQVKAFRSLTSLLAQNDKVFKSDETLIDRLRDVYAKNRNLAEDLGEVSIEATIPCFLQGRVEATGRRPRAEILADIFFQCARTISSDIKLSRYEDLYEPGMDLASLFTGPLTSHGFFETKNSLGVARLTQELIGVIANIEDIKKIHDLCLVDENGDLISLSLQKNCSYHLQLPSEKQLHFFALSYNPGKAADSAELFSIHPEKLKTLLQDALRYIQRLEFEYNAFRESRSSSDSFYSVPAGIPRAELSYFSIQHDFPNVYGINSAGIPSSESVERKTQAKQLKAYLYPLDQLLANFQQHIQDLPNLFKLEDTAQHTYFTQPLNAQHIPHFELLEKNIDAADVSAIQAKYDNYSSRKNRALNTLLAIYGEKFPEEALRNFGDYHQNDVDAWIIRNKIEYLRYLPKLTGERAKGMDLSRPYWQSENLSRFQERIHIFMGLLRPANAHSLLQIFRELKIQLSARINISEEILASELQSLPALNLTQQEFLKDWEFKQSDGFILTFDMLANGLYLNSYRFCRLHDQTLLYLLVKEKPFFLKSFASADAAFVYAHGLKNFLTLVNESCEGLHCIEHILLRPRNQQEATTDDVSVDDFYNYQVSMVFPGWTARTQNPNFRHYIHSLIAEYFQAHLMPHVYWLEIPEIKVFERKYADWLTAYRKFHAQPNDDAQSKILNATAEALVEWIKTQQRSTEYWV